MPGWFSRQISWDFESLKAGARVRGFLVLAGFISEQEDTMFQMIDEDKPSPDDRKVFLYKVGIFFVAMGGVGVFVYFLVTSSYFK